MRHDYFVTGTDTGIGKTFVCCGLLHVLREQGLRAAAMKPVAAGAEERDGHWVNDDVERLRAAAGVEAERQLMNPYLFRSPVAPHIAAAEEGVAIDPNPILAAFGALQSLAEAVIVEGVGGFRVPLDEATDTADLARLLGLPVILVVGMRLGCISHALLTADAIAASGLPFAGWVANQVDPAMARFEENVEALRARLPAPLLGVAPWCPDGDPRSLAPHLRLPPL